MPVRVLCWTLNAVFPEPGWNMDQQVVNQTSYRRQHSLRLLVNQRENIFRAEPFRQDSIVEG
jgi:hypothetical protein